MATPTRVELDIAIIGISIAFVDKLSDSGARQARRSGRPLSSVCFELLHSLVQTLLKLLRDLFARYARAGEIA